MFKLPELGYDYDAVEPYIDAKTMEIHHSKHHNGFVMNLNSILEKVGKIHSTDVSSILENIHDFPEEFQTLIRNNAGGYSNHTLYFRTLRPGNKDNLFEKFKDDINTAFGSLDVLKANLKDTAMKIFGSGWAWLVLCPDSGLKVISMPNQDSPLMKSYKPILGIDVWEHAYYLKYQNRRIEYVDAFLKGLNWEEVSKIYNEANN
ncbi:superoxide dismutase [Borreliella americana]|uniref:superoxide dismutase n=1 Tax=Borreliella americana TaxID=478807 RepID=UPI001E4E3184|nr:superoxide dismutase [Borreliella americana]MCD2349360.1 superoxide dismutase [Borreliella americana]MCD2382467.1 superoxide dismutase [Borreliella americana]